MSPDDIIALFPGPVTLRPWRLKWLSLLAVSLLLIFAGCAMVMSRTEGGWFVLMFGSVGALTATSPLLPGGDALTLHQDGFEIDIMFLKKRTRWRDAGSFETMTRATAPGWEVIYHDTGPYPAFLSVSNPDPEIRNSALPDNYGLRARDLARVMESWRARALAPASETAP
jgi:hypothetical protein